MSREEDEQSVFEWVGRCITAWAAVDDEIFETLATCVGPRDRCAILYFRMPGLDTRINNTDEVVRSILPKVERSGDHPHADLVEWKEIHKIVVGLLSVRRRIAHHQVHLSVYMDGADEQAKLGPFEVFASYQERLRGRVEEDSGLDVAALKTHDASVNSLRDRLQAFRNGALAARLSIHPQQEFQQRSAKNPDT